MDRVSPYKYKAFMSYSHAADGNLAPALQSALYQFAKPWYRRRAMKVFRDETSMAANLYGSVTILATVVGDEQDLR